MGFFFSPSSASEGNLALLSFLALLWSIGMLGPGEAGSKGKWKGEAIHEGRGSKLKSNCEFSDKTHLVGFSAQ